MKAPSKVALTYFLSAFLSLAPSLQNQVLAEPETAKKAEIAQATQTEIKPVSFEISPQVETPIVIEQKLEYEIPIETKYSIILEKCKVTNAESVKRTRKVSGDLEKSIAKFGFESVIEVKNKLDEGCLDVTLRIIKEEISKEDIEKEKERLAREYQERLKETNVSGPINFTSKEMIDAQFEKITADIEFYKRTLRTKLTIPLDAEVNYSYLITSSLSQPEYQEIATQQLDAINKVYDAMLASRKGLKGLVASGQINNIRNVRVNQHKEEAEKIGRIYNPKDNQENKQSNNQEITKK